MFTRRLSSAALCAIFFYLSSAFANQSVPSPPPIEIKTAAIEVVKIKRTEDGYLLYVKNISSKDIVGLDLYTLSKAGDTGFTYLDCGASRGKRFDPMIRVGEQCRVDARIAKSGGFRLPYIPATVERPEEPKIVIGGVAFKDMTFDGEVEAAVISFPYRLGHKIQSDKILYILKKAIESPQGDDSKVLEWLKQQFSALAEEDKQGAILLERIMPGMTELNSNLAWIRLKGTLIDAKKEILSDLKRYQTEQAPKGEALQKWLADRKAHYEDELKRLQEQ